MPPNTPGFLLRVLRWSLSKSRVRRGLLPGCRVKATIPVSGHYAVTFGCNRISGHYALQEARPEKGKLSRKKKGRRKHRAALGKMLFKSSSRIFLPPSPAEEPDTSDGQQHKTGRFGNHAQVHFYRAGEQLGSKVLAQPKSYHHGRDVRVAKVSTALK